MNRQQEVLAPSNVRSLHHPAPPKRSASPAPLWTNIPIERLPDLTHRGSRERGQHRELPVLAGDPRTTSIQEHQQVRLMVHRLQRQ
jgi:hypothetical protein